MEEKKQEKKGGFFQGFLVLLLLILAGGGGILYKTYHDLQQDYRNLEKNKDQIVAAEVKAQISEAKEAEHDKVMEFFRVGLEEEHTIDFLRTVYKEDYLVYERASHFLFRPLLDVEMADYSNGSFVKDSETGFIDYQVKKTGSKRSLLTFNTMLYVDNSNATKISQIEYPDDWYYLDDKSEGKHIGITIIDGHGEITVTSQPKANTYIDGLNARLNGIFAKVLPEDASILRILKSPR